MMAKIIDGKQAALALRERVSAGIAALVQSGGRAPGLAVVLVGEDPASAIYVRNKGVQAEAAGMRSVTHRLASDTTSSTLLALVRALNTDPSIDGILVQLPLPAHIDEAAVLDAIDSAKDVDGFHPTNVGRLASGLPALTPCTPLGCVILLREVLPNLTGLHAVIVGRSNIVGKPLAQLLLAAHCTVTIAHSRSVEIAALTRSADILVAAAGRPELVRGDWIKPGATVIDVGINRVTGQDGAPSRIVGDVAFAEALPIAGAITPVPGGVGPMTIACLLLNTVIAHCERTGAALPPVLRADAPGVAVER